MFLHHVTSYYISPISTNQTKGECMQNLLNEREIFILDWMEPEFFKSGLPVSSGSLFISDRLDGNFFWGCFFNLWQR